MVGRLQGFEGGRGKVVERAAMEVGGSAGFILELASLVRAAALAAAGLATQERPED